MKIGKIKLFETELISAPTGEPYLRRTKILTTPWFGIMFHVILRSDWDRDLHSHPWNFTSFILRGSYVEHLRRYVGSPSFSTYGTETIRLRRAFSFGRLLAKDLHYLELPRNGQGGKDPVWSLVFHGRNQNSWGFQTPDGFVHAQDYEKLGRK